MPDEWDEPLRDDNGRILRYADGSPVPKRHFTGDPDDDDEHDGYVPYASTREFIEDSLSRGRYVSEPVLLENGYRKIDGKWVYQGDESD